jgi:hypothetical protein
MATVLFLNLVPECEPTALFKTRLKENAGKFSCCWYPLSPPDSCIDSALFEHASALVV